MNYTSYSANGGMDAGGFLASSQGEGQGTKSKYGKDSLRPVTIKQLLNAFHPTADAEHFMIDDCETTQITFVAQIRNFSAQATNYTYKMDDGSGIIEAKVWVDADSMNNDSDNPQAREREKLSEGAYARVFGRLKEFGQKRHVGAQIVRAITDFNEIQYHLLEATYVHLLATRGAPGAQSKTVANGTNGYGNGHDNLSADGRVLPSGTSLTTRKVWDAIKSAPAQSEGLHAQQIGSTTGLDYSNVCKATDELINLGFIYTTVDEQTWAVLEC